MSFLHKCIVTLLASALNQTAIAGELWCSDTNRSELEFITRFEGAQAIGAFRNFNVHFRFAGKAEKQHQLDVDIEIISGDMGSRDLNEGMMTPEWFDADSFPDAKFRSTSIEPEEPERPDTSEKPARFLATGTLLLKGQEVPVTVPFKWESNVQTARITGETELSRMSFEIGSGEWADNSIIAHTVVVRFDVYLNPCS